MTRPKARGWQHLPARPPDALPGPGVPLPPFMVLGACDGDRALLAADHPTPLRSLVLVRAGVPVWVEPIGEER